MKQLKKFDLFLTNEQKTITGGSDWKKYDGKRGTIGPNFKKFLEYLKGKKFKMGDLIYLVPPNVEAGYVNEQNKWVINLIPMKNIDGEDLDDNFSSKYRCQLIIYNKPGKRPKPWVIIISPVNSGEDRYLEEKYPSIYNKLADLCEKYRLVDDLKSNDDTKVDFE